MHHEELATRLRAVAERASVVTDVPAARRDADVQHGWVGATTRGGAVRCDEGGAAAGDGVRRRVSGGACVRCVMKEVDRLWRLCVYLRRLK